MGTACSLAPTKPEETARRSHTSERALVPPTEEQERGRAYRIEFLLHLEEAWCLAGRTRARLVIGILMHRHDEIPVALIIQGGSILNLRMGTGKRHFFQGMCIFGELEVGQSSAGSLEDLPPTSMTSVVFRQLGNLVPTTDRGHDPAQLFLSHLMAGRQAKPSPLARSQERSISPGEKKERISCSPSGVPSIWVVRTGPQRSSWSVWISPSDLQFHVIHTVLLGTNRFGEMSRHTRQTRGLG